MSQKHCEFGDYLKYLIKKSGMTQTEFYSKLQIKKPYFYDIVSGRVNPPPHEVQFKVVQLLGINKDEKEKFFDLAANVRGDLPADVKKIIEDNPLIVKEIRKEYANEPC